MDWHHYRFQMDLYWPKKHQIGQSRTVQILCFSKLSNFMHFLPRCINKGPGILHYLMQLFQICWATGPFCYFTLIFHLCKKFKILAYEIHNKVKDKTFNSTKISTVHLVKIVCNKNWLASVSSGIRNNFETDLLRCWIVYINL